MELVFTGAMPHLLFRKGFTLPFLHARLESGKILQRSSKHSVILFFPNRGEERSERLDVLLKATQHFNERVGIQSTVIAFPLLQHFAYLSFCLSSTWGS